MLYMTSWRYVSIMCSSSLNLWKYKTGIWTFIHWKYFNILYIIIYFYGYIFRTLNNQNKWITSCYKNLLFGLNIFIIFRTYTVISYQNEHFTRRHNEWNPSKTEPLKTGNPSKLKGFVSPEFLSSYFNLPL